MAVIKYQCECCGQNVVEYERQIYAAMASALIRLYWRDHNFPGQHHHITEFGAIPKNGGGDFSKLEYWGLIERVPVSDEDKKYSGRWLITPDGRDFVEGKTTVVKYAHIELGKLVKFSGRADWSIINALGKNFSYAELMANL